MKKLTRIVYVTIAILAVTGTAIAPANASPASQGKGKLTVKQFEAELARNAGLAPEAKANYESFAAFPAAKKQKLADYLNDPSFLTEVISEMAQLSSANSAQEVKVTHGGDAVVAKTSNQKDSLAMNGNKGAMTLAADRTFDRVSQYTYSLMGITLTRVRLDMNFAYNVSRVTAVNSCVPSHTNYFPLRGMAATPSSYLSGNNGVCQATWQIAVGWVNGLNLGQRAALQKVVQGPWGLVSDSFVNI